MAEIKTHTLNLTKGAVTLIKTTLAIPGWYEGLRLSTTVRASDLQEKPEVSDLKMPDEAKGKPEAEDAWAREPMELVVTEGEREAAKACIKHFLKKAQLQVSVHTRALIHELGLADD